MGDTMDTMTENTERLPQTALIDFNDDEIYGTKPKQKQLDNLKSDYAKRIKESYLDVELKKSTNIKEKLVVDFNQYQIRYEKNERYGQSTKETSIILECIPTDVIIYDNKIFEEPTKYYIRWIYNPSLNKDDIEYTGTLDEHKTILTQDIGTKIIKQNKLTPYLNCILSEYREYGIRKENEEICSIINTPSVEGFFYDTHNKRIISTNPKPIEQPTDEELLNAIETLNEVKEYTGGNIDKYAYIIRWSIIAPFFFVLKQLGYRNEDYIYLTGESGVGKTNLYGRISEYIQGRPFNNENGESSITGINSDAQLRKQLEKSTYGKLIDEAGNLFESKNQQLLSTIKIATQNMKTKEIHDKNNILRKQYALAPLLLTSNRGLTDNDKNAIINRFTIMEFSKDDVPTKEDKEAFNAKFGGLYDTEKENPLFKVEALGRAFAYDVIDDNNILKNTSIDENRKNISVKHTKEHDNIVKNWLINTFNISFDNMRYSWLLNDYQTTTTNENNDERIHKIKSCILERLKIEWIQYRRANPSEGIDSEDETYSIMKTIEKMLKKNFLTWITLNTRNNKDYIYINSGLLDILEKKGITDSLAVISGLIGYESEYKTHSINGNKIKSIKIDKNKFYKVLGVYKPNTLSDA